MDTAEKLTILSRDSQYDLACACGTQADEHRLLRVPGLGQVTVERILAFRQNKTGIRSLEDLGRQNKLFMKAGQYVTF